MISTGVFMGDLIPDTTLAIFRRASRKFPASQGARILVNCLFLEICLVSSLLLWGQMQPGSGLSAAQELVEQGSFDKAVTVCLNEIRLHPQSAEAYVLLGIAYAALDKNEDAIAALRHAIQLRPSSLPAHTNLGIVYMQSQQTKAAMTELERAVELGDHQWTTLYNLALCYQAAGRPRQAKPLLAEVVSLAPDRSEPRLTLSSVEFDLGEREAALNELQKVEAVAPTDLELRKKVAAQYMKHGVFDRAAEALQAIVEDDPRDIPTRLQLGQAYVHLKRYQDVFKVLSFPPTAQWDNRQAAMAGYLSAAARSGLEDWLAAIDDCRKAVKLDPQPVYYGELVRILLRTGAMGDALTYARAAVEKFPNSVDALRALATAAVPNLLKDEAVGALKNIIRLSPEDQEAYIQLANLYLNGGDFSAARNIFSDMRQRFPKSEEPYLGLALIQMREGEPSKGTAQSYLEEALRRNPNNAGALYYYGKILFRGGQFGQALDYLQRSAALLPAYSSDLVAVHHEEGQCYLRLGHKDKAQEEFDLQKKLLDQLEGRELDIENQLLLDQLEGRSDDP